MNSNNEEFDMRSHSHHSSHSGNCESSESDNCGQMPIRPMPSYNPCMCCPMMYGMGMQGGQMMYGGMGMQGGQMMDGDGMSMAQYGAQDSREEDENRYHTHYYGHPVYYGHSYYPYKHGYYYHYHR